MCVDAGGERDGAEADLLRDPVRKYRSGLDRGDFLAIGVFVVLSDEEGNIVHFQTPLFSVVFFPYIYNIHKYLK